MTREDEAELDWWRKSFTCRFGPGNLPKPGSMLLGRRFVLTELINGELVPYEVKR